MDITILDRTLLPYRDIILQRHEKALKLIHLLDENEGGLLNFSQGYKFYGFNVTLDGDVVYREWAPNASEAFLIGDFNDWNRLSHPMRKLKNGVFEIIIAGSDGKPIIPHDTRVKKHVSMVAPGHFDRLERIPAWITRALPDDDCPLYNGRFWYPGESERYVFKNPSPKPPQNLKIYEAHVGISSAEFKITSYEEFTLNVLPRIRRLGYNALQLMAIMEHAYYASFGYHVNCFFACSSRFGTPEQFKRLIDTAHKIGLIVIMDIVHSHASKNVLDGLSCFDGTDQYFHSGERGLHPLWDSRLFNYRNFEVIRFLLSNLRFWMEEYRMDGFRFDGITSILYVDHGIERHFTGNYDEYFNELVDEDAVVYLMLANEMIHRVNKACLTIAEDVSGMPGLCVPVSMKGIGFDYRLGMGIPNFFFKWAKVPKEQPWPMKQLTSVLCDRRVNEKTVAYCESHDQSIVGEKTLMMWFCNEEIYNNMSTLQPATQVIERAMALHKIIRLVTHMIGGEAYMNFEGNEFGHPEWLDFPRSGNDYSFLYARRLFYLSDDKSLRYAQLERFDEQLQAVEEEYKWLNSKNARITLTHEQDQVIAYERAGVIGVVNFHGDRDYTNYHIGVSHPGIYRIILSTDYWEFGGKSTRENMYEALSEPSKMLTQGKLYKFTLNIPRLPKQTGIIFQLKENVSIR